MNTRRSLRNIIGGSITFVLLSMAFASIPADARPFHSKHVKHHAKHVKQLNSVEHRLLTAYVNDGTEVDIQTVDGETLTGVITAFDRRIILLDTGSPFVAIYKRAIITIMEKPPEVE